MEKCLSSRRMLFLLLVREKSCLLNGILKWNIMFTGKPKEIDVRCTLFIILFLLLIAVITWRYTIGMELVMMTYLPRLCLLSSCRTSLTWIAWTPDNAASETSGKGRAKLSPSAHLMVSFASIYRFDSFTFYFLTLGKCFIIHKSGRTERVIDAHKGAVLNVKWNHDGTGLLTSGEDGLLKIWSRSGMLRSTHAQTDSPIYSAVWSPFSSSILYSYGKVLTVQPFTSTNDKVISL